MRISENKKLLTIALSAAVLFLLFAFVFRKSEPSFQGKPLSVWIRGLEYENVNPREDQRAALRAMGKPAVHWLVRLLEQRDSFPKRLFLAFAETHPRLLNRFVARNRIVSENDYRAQAATALGEIGPAASEAIPALEAASNDPYFIIKARAKAALIKIRQDSIASLLQLLNDFQSTNWFQAAKMAQYLGTNGQPAIPLLIDALAATNSSVREAATSALGGIASSPEITVPALVDCIKKETSASVQRSAIDALCQFKAEKEQLVPILLKFLQSTDLNVWLGAAFGLRDLLSPDEKKTLFASALKQSLNSSDSSIRINADLFLKRIERTTTRGASK